MWTSFEIQKVKEMYSKLEEEKIEDFLPTDFIDVIKAEGGMAYENLRYALYRLNTVQFVQNEHCSI